ncbi:transposase [Streptomyces sp. NPDC086549]|uniref:transposase n=1 Tax=Streptomyces sp. NPDC086549 TaxID=3365752 RepID=UPI0037FC95F4
MALPDPQPSTPRVLGVDDFATRRGQTYSTVLTCGETHRVIDVLPTREAGPLAAWLTTHPSVEIIYRDRAGAYASAEGARLGAPDALQVADRFHLRQGIGRAVETCVAAHRDCLRAPTLPLSEGVDTPHDGAVRVSPDLDGRRAQRKKAAHALVHDLLAQGHSRRAIARHLGWGLNTVLRYARAANWQETLRKPATAQSTGPLQALSRATVRRGAAPASPACTANSSPSMLPSPTRWSAPTSPPRPPHRQKHRPRRHRCGR